jgi:adenylosuccinate synthase
MHSLHDLYRAVYEKGELFGIDKPGADRLQTPDRRADSVAIAGGALGDEGKGRVTDELTAHFLQDRGEVIHYRDNGGANAGHTIHVGETKIALHQLGSGILQKGCTIILGKEMVLHPEDLVSEINMVLDAIKGKLPAKLLIDEQAVLSLDTHRAFESILKKRESGGSGSTGRGISPAYADVLYRHPVRMRDLAAKDWKKRLEKHYQLYTDLCSGLGEKMAICEVPRLVGDKVPVGDLKSFLSQLSEARAVILPFVSDVSGYISKAWESTVPFVFEKAQAIGLDPRWGVYPDITASNCTFDGIYSSTEGVVDPLRLAVRAATIKATYNSSVGSRTMPTIMGEALAHRIREDANEYGATTKRPRDIIHIDLPMLRFLFRVGRVEQLVMTHLDVAYKEAPIKVCIAYEQNGKEVAYRPDQEFLSTVTPVYLKLPSWDGAALAGATTLEELPLEATRYIAFISAALNVKMLMVTTGAKRSEAIRWF